MKLVYKKLEKNKIRAVVVDAYGLSFDEGALDKAKSSLQRIETALNIKF